MEMLQKMMEEMELCFSVQCGDLQTPRYFAPAVFAEVKDKRSAQGLRQLPGWQFAADNCNKSREVNITFAGVRVQCRDRQRTTLTPVFFPRFQIYFRNLLISSQRLRTDQIVCDYDLIYMIFDEYIVYVEGDGNQGDHIDILVRSSNSYSETFKFVQLHVVKEIQDFCASSKGCPGVALVVGVLRTDCVRNLTLSAHRDEHQAILIEDLKRKWKEYIMNRDVEDNKMWEEEKLVNYHHVWPASHYLNMKREKAQDLLTDEDYIEVLRSVKATAGSLEKQLDNLKGIEDDIIKKVKDSSLVAESSSGQLNGESSIPQYFESSTSIPLPESRRLQRGMSDLMIGHDKTQFEIRKLGQRMDEKFDEMNFMIQRDVNNIQYYQNKILETMLSIHGKLDQLIGRITSLPKSELPSRPYLTTSDVKWIHRISAVISVGRAMTLHFMCEERSGNHLVANQPGFPIIVTKENREVLRLVSMNSLRVLWYMLKAGIHVTAGLDNIIPDMEGGGQTILLTAAAVGNLLMDLESNMKAENPKKDETSIDIELWKYLKQLFVESLKGKCGERFLLYRVRYDTSADSDQGWLCKECVDKVKRMKTLFVDG